MEFIDKDGELQNIQKRYVLMSNLTSRMEKCVVSGESWIGLQSFNDYVTLHLLLACPDDTVEQQKLYIIQSLKKPKPAHQSAISIAMSSNFSPP